ncbi:hypothetical protein B0H14DRAFT_3876268 [Mycena olivaceomarginata]|nr:hypothetical protein B0H14DRAFT_3876268 [Mycena olivaceomarginata]
MQAIKAAAQGTSPLATRIKVFESPLPISRAAVIAAGTKAFATRWREEWSSSPRHARISTFETRPPPSVLTQLRTGHIGLNAYLHRYRLAPSPLCPHCGVPESVPHFLLVCPAQEATCLICKSQHQAKIADATTNAPSSISRGITMDWKDWFRKQLEQMADHAADQGRKHELIIEDLGEQESGAFSIAELFDALLAISEEEIQEKSGKDYNDLWGDLFLDSVRSFFSETYDALSDDLKALADFPIFGGCCNHKDMNTFKYGCKKMEGAWPEGEEPVLLANKANSTTIRLGERDSAVVRAAEHASSRGVVKAMALLGAL